jgi:hypothetical protein
MFEPFKVSTIDPDCYNRFKHLRKNTWEVGASLMLTPKGDKIISLKNKMMTLAEIFLKHPRRATYSRTVFNPMPKDFVDGPKEDELNMWSGEPFIIEKL